MKKIFALATVLLSSAFFCLNAQETWSLDKCIEYAKEHNIQLRKQILNAEIRKNNNAQSKLDMLPNLSATASHTFSYGRTVSYTTNTYVDRNEQGSRFSLRSDMTLFNGFQKLNNLKKSKLDLQASLQDVEKGKEDLALNITSLYLNVLFKQELLQVAKEQLKITNLQIERTSLLVEAGTLPKGTLMEQKAQAAREEVTVVTAQNDLDLALLDLAQILDLESPENFNVEVPQLPVINANKSIIDPNSVYINALEFRPEIKAAKFRLQSSEKAVSIALGQRSPSVSLEGSWSTRYSNSLPDPVRELKEMRFSDQLKNNENKYFGFGINIPIFSRGTITRNISNARVQTMQSKLDLENSSNMLRKEVQQAHANAIASMKKYFSSDMAVSSTEEAFRYTQEKFNLGLVNSVDYNEAKNNLLKAKSNLLQAKYEYIFRTKILDFYNGVAISL